MGLKELINEERAALDDQPTRAIGVALGSAGIEVTFTKLRGDEWQALTAACPPRAEAQGDRALGWDETALVRRYPLDSVRVDGDAVDAETWGEFIEVLDGPQRNNLAVTIWELNVNTTLKRLAALGKAQAGQRSRLPAKRGSRRAGSTGGSPRKSPATSTTKRAISTTQ